MSSFRRRAFLLALLPCVLLLSGCVYLRLLQLKLQLGKFDQNFALQADDGLALTFRNPMLLDEDVENFFNWRPETRRRVGAAENWRFRWVKERVEADGDRAPVELSIDLTFVDHKLVKFQAPETFFAATMPKPLAIAALRSLGGAKVDRAGRKATSTITADELQTAATAEFLSESGIQSALGAPVATGGKPEAPEWLYRFAPASKEQRFGESGVVETRFTFDPATKRVRLMKGKTVFGEVVFDTVHIGPEATGTMNAAVSKR